MPNSPIRRWFFTAELQKQCLDLLTNNHVPPPPPLCAGSVLGVHRRGNTAYGNTSPTLIPLSMWLVIWELTILILEGMGGGVGGRCFPGVRDGFCSQAVGGCNG